MRMNSGSNNQLLYFCTIHRIEKNCHNKVCAKWPVPENRCTPPVIEGLASSDFQTRTFSPQVLIQELLGNPDPYTHNLKA